MDINSEYMRYYQTLRRRKNRHEHYRDYQDYHVSELLDGRAGGGVDRQPDLADYSRDFVDDRRSSASSRYRGVDDVRTARQQPYDDDFQVY